MINSWRSTAPIARCSMHDLVAPPGGGMPAARQAIRVDGSSFGLAVVRGYLDLFAVTISGSQRGRRHHLLRIEESHAGFGPASKSTVGDFEIIAVPGLDTELRSL